MNLMMQNDVLTTDANLEDIMQWRNKQLDILRTQRILTRAEQEKYRANTLKEDAARFSNKTHMWGIVTWGDDYADKDFIGYCGLTNIDWGPGFVIKAETSFIVEPSITKDPDKYEEVFTFFLTEIKKLFFGSDYWNGHRLYSESYALPYREHHISILEKNGFIREGVLRQHILRNGEFIDSILHGLNRGDL